MTFTTIEKVKIGEFLNEMEIPDLLSLAETVSNHRIALPKNDKGLCIRKIIFHSNSAKELLKRKKISKEILFAYLLKNHVNVTLKEEKSAFIEKAIKYWKSFETKKRPLEVETVKEDEVPGPAPKKPFQLDFNENPEEPKQHYEPKVVVEAKIDSEIMVTRYMMIPARQVGNVIGRGGQTIERLKAESGCEIRIDNESVEQNDNLAQKQCLIYGPPEAVAHTIRSINDILFNSGHLDFPVPTIRVGLIIGKNGETIRKLQETSKAKINILPNDEGNGLYKICRIIGNYQTIHTAKGLIDDVIKQNMGGFGAQTTDYLTIPGDKTGLVIGKKGQTIQKIIQDSGASCTINQQDRSVVSGSSNESSTTVTIRGTQEAIDKAKCMIFSVLGMRITASTYGNPDEFFRHEEPRRNFVPQNDRRVSVPMAPRVPEIPPRSQLGNDAQSLRFYRDVGLLQEAQDIRFRLEQEGNSAKVKSMLTFLKS